MAFNFGSLFSAVGRALPGYVEGHRAAVQDNWNDLNQYNRVQAGQFDNAWTEETWDERLANVRMQMYNNALGLTRNAMATGLDVAAYPGLFTQRSSMSANAPWANDEYWRMMSRIYRMGGNPNTMGVVPPAPGAGMGMGSANPPSGLR